MKVRCLLIGVVALFIAGLLTTSSYAKIDPGTIAAMWLFDEGDGDIAEDTSGNGYDGKLMNGVEWAQGKFGTALQFDGTDDYVEVGIVPCPANSLTISFWCHMPEVPSGWVYIIDNGRTEHGFHGSYRVELLSPKEGMYYTSIGDGAVNVQSDPTGASGDDIGWEYGDWFHIAFTYDGSKGRTYLNGTEVHTFDADIDLSKGAGTVFIGCGNRTEYWFKGLLDEFVLFDAVLTENDIKSVIKGMLNALDVSPEGRITTWATIKAR